MFHQNRFDGFIGQKPPFGMAAPIKNQTCHPIIPLVKPCSSTALRSYPSAYPSRLGSLILANQYKCGGVIFFFDVPPLTAFHIPGKVPGTYRHRLHGQPRQPLPGHTRKIEFVTMMSTFKFSLRLELVVCRDFIFDSIQGEFILLYTKQEIQSFSDEFIYSRMKELLSSPLCRDIPESEQVDCLFCLERYDCANSIPPEFFQLNDEFQRRRYINRRRAAK